MILGMRRSVLKEFYLSVFVLWLRIARGTWSPTSKGDAYRGAAGITLVELLLVLTISNVVHVVVGRRLVFGEYDAGIAAFCLYWINAHFLVRRGAGISFDEEFSGFERKKQLALYAVATAITLSAVVSFLLSVTLYQKFYPGSQPG